MRALIRSTLALASAALVALLTAAVALGGNYAEVTMLDDGSNEGAVTAGEPREMRFELLQHGVTPVETGTVTVTATLPGTGEAVTATATSAGDGIWSATVTFPRDGAWELRVIHSVLETPPAVTLEVAAAPLGGIAPGAATLVGTVALALALVVLATRRARTASTDRREAVTHPVG